MNYILPYSLLVDAGMDCNMLFIMVYSLCLFLLIISILFNVYGCLPACMSAQHVHKTRRRCQIH